MVTLITGSAGALGTELKKIYPNALAPTHKELDLCDRKAVFNFFEKNTNIDVIIHAGALTGIRPCEENQPLAWKTNVEGTRNLVDAVLDSKRKIQFIYVSTACVFDGHHEMYKESSIPYPENFYALTKLVGEHEIRRLPEYLIARTNFVAKKKVAAPEGLY